MGRFAPPGRAGILPDGPGILPGRTDMEGRLNAEARNSIRRAGLPDASRDLECTTTPDVPGRIFGTAG